MEPQILPVSMPRLASSASISSTLPPPSTVGKMLLKAHDDSPARLLFSSPSLEDGSGMDIMPLLGRSSSFQSDPISVAAAVPGVGTKMNEKRRRRFLSDPSVASAPGVRDQASLRDVRDGAAETFLLTRLGLKLLRYIRIGCRWILRLFALGFYSLLLAPGVLQVAYYYCFSSHIRRGIVYGDQPRNKLDLYFPRNNNGPKPVVAFVTGGAWIIGYKAWGTLLGKHLSESNIMVACIDYRNFPQVNISDMVKDASQGISFICNNIAEYGGDPNRIFLMGQSAGAHIASCALVEQAINEAKGQNVSWSVSKINAYFGLSGGYNLFTLMDFLRNRGLCNSIFLSIMGGEQSLQRYSPEVRVQDPNNKAALSLLPPVVLFHGTADYSIPSYCSKSFVEALQKIGVKAKSIMYEGKTHTDLFVQDPMRGGQDEMLKALVSLIHGEESEAVAATQRRLAPELFLKLAGWVSPF